MLDYLQQLLGLGNGLYGAFGPGMQQRNPSAGIYPFGFMPQQQNSGLSGLLGAGLLGAGLAQNPEPGYAAEARQAMRNIEQPQGYTSVFNQTVGGLKDQFLPLLNQQADIGIKNISQQYANAFPGTVGMQGPQVQGLEKYLREQLVPTQQAFLGGLGMQGIGQQQQAAYNVLDTAIPNQLGNALTSLGGSMLQGGGLSNLLGGVGNLFGLNGTQTGSGLGSISGWPPDGNWNLPSGTIFDNWGVPLGGTSASNLQWLQQNPGALTNSAISNLAFGNALQGLGRELFNQSIQFGAPMANGVIPIMGQTGNVMATYNPAMGTISDLQGQVLANGVNAQSLGVGAQGHSLPLSGMGQSGFGSLLSGFNPFSAGFAPGFQTGLGTGFGNLTGSLGGAFSGLGTAAAGFGAGNLIGSQLPHEQLGATAAGAAGGAGAGALLGTFIFPGIGTALGAVLGAIGGGGGGLMGAHGAAVQQKAAAFSADQRSQANNVSMEKSFWGEALGASGVDPSSALSGATVEEVARQGSSALLRQLQQGAMAQGMQPPGSLNDVPGFRDRYIQYIMSHYQIQQGSGVTGVQNAQQAGGAFEAAGIPTPGTTQHGTLPFELSQFYSGHFNQFTGGPEVDIPKVLSWMGSQGVTVPSSVASYLSTQQQGGTTAQIIMELVNAKRENRQPNMSQFGL